MIVTNLVGGAIGKAVCNRKVWVGFGVLRPPQFSFTIELHKDKETWEFAICVLFFFANIHIMRAGVTA